MYFILLYLSVVYYSNLLKILHSSKSKREKIAILRLLLPINIFCVSISLFCFSSREFGL